MNAALEKLPKGWQIKPLGEICELVIGKTPSRKRADFWSGGSFHWVTIGDMKSSQIQQTEEKINERAIKETKIPLIPSGTILLSFKLSLGKVAVAGVDLYTNEAIVAVIPKNEHEILKEYLFYFLKSLDLVKFARDAVKGKTVNKSILQKIPLERISK